MMKHLLDSMCLWLNTLGLILTSIYIGRDPFARNFSKMPILPSPFLTTNFSASIFSTYQFETVNLPIGFVDARDGLRQ